MQRFGDAETHESLIDSFALIAFCDGSAALAILQMPFLDDAGVGPYFEIGDRLILDGLSRLALSSLDDLNSVLSHPELQGGITDGATGLILLLILDREDATAAAAIRALPWIEDGITYIDRDVWAEGFVEDETAHVMGLVDMARRANRSFWAFLDIPWVRDGYDWTEWPIINDLQRMAQWDDGATARVLGMPFLATPSYSDGRITSLLLEVAYRRALQRLLSSHWLAGGIRDDQLATVALVDLELQKPDAAGALNDLAWLRDGIDPSEQDAVLSLVNAVVKSDAIFRALLAKSWVQDGLTPDERDVIGRLSTMVSTSVDGKTDEATPLRILDMPFMEEITSLDAAALTSLSLMFSDDQGTLQQVLAHPELRGGITDDLTDLVAVASLATRSPGLLEVLLDPERTLVHKREVELPLAGKVLLSVIEFRPEEPVFALSVEALLDPMDLLEHSVSTYEEFMEVAFPQSHVVLFVADVDPLFAGSYFGHGRIASDWRSSASVIAHETAHIWNFTPITHIWLTQPTTWIREGAAEFLTAISERARRGTPLPEPGGSCSIAGNIAELVRVEADPDVIYSSGCNYHLGRAMFLELYSSLGDTAFRQGLRNLYLMSAEDVAARYGPGECGGIDAGVCHLKAAFLSDMTPQQSAVVDEIITRRYFGASQ